MFYDIFVNLCKKNGVSQTKAINEVGLNRSSITKWKKGAVPSGSTLEKFSKYFNVTTDYLLEKEEKPTAENDSELVNNDEELTEYLEELKNRPELRMMFQLAKGATKEDVEKAVEIIEAFLK